MSDVSALIRIIHELLTHWRTTMADLAQIHAALDRLTASEGKIDADVQNVKTAIATLTTSNDALTGQIATLEQTITELQAQIASGAGVTAADLDAVLAQVYAVADQVDAQDVALDSIAPDPDPVTLTS